MPYSASHKASTRQRILGSARIIFTAKGLAGASIDEIMGTCGLTRGAFYRHFSSKGQLYAEAMSTAGAAELACDPRLVGDWWEEILAAAESAGESASVGSRWEFLATEIGSKAAEARRTYTRAVRQLLGSGTGTSGEAAAMPDQAAVIRLSVVLGTLAVARTVQDAHLREAFVRSCRVYLEQDGARPIEPDCALLWSADA